MEIGSIFEINLEELFKKGKSEFYLPFMENKNYDYHYFFNTGRSAIEYLLRQISSSKVNNKILLPAFNCSSVIDAVKRANVEYDFYSIKENFQINIDSIKEKLDDTVQFIYIIQYFGGYQNQESYEFLKELQSRNLIIIEDISHALYTKHQKYIGFGDYVLGSIRKWLPIPDGAFLSSFHNMPRTPIDNGYNEYTFNYFAAQLMKKAYLLNESLDKNQYLNLNNKAMKALFSDYTIRRMTDLSLNYLYSYDMNELIKKRIRNYNYLIKNTKRFPFITPVKLQDGGQVPFGFIVLSEQRDELLKHLIENNIYCNIHWKITEECSKIDVISCMISERILTIPCDQRYGEFEMEYIVDVLDKFNPELKQR